MLKHTYIPLTIHKLISLPSTNFLQLMVSDKQHKQPLFGHLPAHAAPSYLLTNSLPTCPALQVKTKPTEPLE